MCLHAYVLCLELSYACKLLCFHASHQMTLVHTSHAELSFSCAQVLLKLCRARSSMNQHAEAMNNCQTAYTALTDPGPGVSASPTRVREALSARAEAHERDKNFDDAVTDVRAALGMAGGEHEMELQQRLQRLQESQRRWRCIDPEDHASWRSNQCGQHSWDNTRDHHAVLDLPPNLNELKREGQCSWVTKQYRKLARVWHPDRYKGNKARAERKMRECAEAKEMLVKRYRCGSK